MRVRWLFVPVVAGLALTSCNEDEGGVVDVGATARSRTIAASGTQGAMQVAAAERVRDELTDAVTRARNFQAGLLMLRIQITGSALSETAERTAQESVLAACDGWPRELNVQFWPPEYQAFYPATSASCTGVETVLKALRDNVDATTVRELWQNVITDLTVKTGFDIELGQMLARLPYQSPGDLLRAIQARQ